VVLDLEFQKGVDRCESLRVFSHDPDPGSLFGLFVHILDLVFCFLHLRHARRYHPVNGKRACEVSAFELLRDLRQMGPDLIAAVRVFAVVSFYLYGPPSLAIKKWWVVAVCENPMAFSPFSITIL